MGKAYKAPARQRGPERYVSRHAVARLRERAEVATHMSDDELSRVLDDAVARAYGEGRNENVRDEAGEPADLVDISNALDGVTARGEVFALVKTNERSDSQFKEAIVTVVGDKAAGSIREQTKHAEPFNPALAGLSQVKLPSGGEATVRPMAEASQQEQEAAGLPAPETPGEFMVTDSVGCLLTREAALERLRENPSLMLFKLVPFKVEVRIDD